MLWIFFIFFSNDLFELFFYWSGASEQIHSCRWIRFLKTKTKQPPYITIWDGLRTMLQILLLITKTWMTRWKRKILPSFICHQNHQFSWRRFDSVLILLKSCELSICTNFQALEGQQESLKWNGCPIGKKRKKKAKTEYYRHA